jgi:predicted transcriptional regulator
MDVSLPPELQAKLARIAQARGTDPQQLVREAIEGLIEYDDWFVREVERGLAQVKSDKSLTHREVGARLNEFLTSKQPRG